MSGPQATYFTSFLVPTTKHKEPDRRSCKKPREKHEKKLNPEKGFLKETALNQ